jgi:hypothetical protein
VSRARATRLNSMDEFRLLWSNWIVEFRSLHGEFVVVVSISIVFVVVDSLSFAPPSCLLVIPCYTNGFT